MGLQMTAQTERRLWSDTELRAAIDVYLYMLRLESSNIAFSRREIEKNANIGDLYQRNTASIRYRLRNISFVMQERGLPTLKSYTPARQVGKNVRARIALILTSYAGEIDAIKNVRNRHAHNIEPHQDPVSSLIELEKSLRNFLTRSEIGIGHNRPPDTIHVSKDDILAAIQSTLQLKSSFEQKDRSKDSLTKKARPLVRVGQKIAQWLGQRLNEFSSEASKSAGKTAGTVGVATAGLSLGGLGNQIIETLQSVFQNLF